MDEKPKPTRRSRWSFSLRTLFVMLTLTTLGSYWLARPTILAHQFLRAIDARDYAAAENLFVHADADGLGSFPGRFTTDRQLRKTTISLQPLTLQDLLRMRRYIYVKAPYVAPREVDSEWSFELYITSTAYGLQVTSWSH